MGIIIGTIKLKIATTESLLKPFILWIYYSSFLICSMSSFLFASLIFIMKTAAKDFNDSKPAFSPCSIHWIVLMLNPLISDNWSCDQCHSNLNFLDLLN